MGNRLIKNYFRETILFGVTMNESEIKNKFKILLVDDETSIRVTLGEFLKDADYYVETAENVETAMRILSESKFDVVISDIIMPKISGMEFLIMIKDKYPDIQVILMTGEPTIKTVSIAVRERASDYLSKPVGKSDIIKAVSNAVKIKKINDERLLLLKENKNYQENLEQLVKEKTDSLEESEARFKAISESASDSIICINEEWEIIFINNATEHLFGVSRKNIIGKKFRVLIPDRYWNIKQDGLQYLLTDSVKNMIGNTIEIHGIRNGDFEFPIELSLSEWTINNKHYFSTIIRDITSRKKIQEKQKISEEKYRALYENSPLPYQSLNENGEFIDINPAWLRTLGYQRDEVIGFHFTEFLHPDYKNNFQNNFEIFKKNGIVHGVKYEIRHKEGHYLYISYEGCIGLSPDGKFRQTYCVFQDITSIYKAQKALEKSENKFREIIKGDVSGIVVYQAIDNGKNFIIQDFNPRAEEIEKISKEEVIGKKVTEAFPGVEEFGILNVFQEVWQTGIPQSHPLSLYEDDRIKGYRENYIYKLNTGEIVATYQDLTEKKQIENSLIASEELFRKAFYTSPDAVNINRLEDGMYISVNKGFTKISGYTEEEVIGKTSTELGIWFDNNDRLKLINGLKKDGTLTNLEYKFKLKNGKIIDCLMSATILNVDGDEHILSITKDITERKIAQKVFRESQRQLSTLMANLPGMAFCC
jgi:PAS domain S-box-containing protein